MNVDRIGKSTTQQPVAGSEAARPPEAQAPGPAIATDAVTWSDGARPRPAGPKEGDGQFTLGQATKFFARGLAYPVLSLIEGFKQRPAQTALLLGGGLAAFGALTWGLPLALTALGAATIAPFAVPAVLGGLAAFFGIKGGVNLVKGALAAREHHTKGEFDLAERDFERIGQGVFDVASAGVAGKQAYDAFRTAQAARAAMVATANAEAYAASLPTRLTDLETKLGALTKGQAMSAQGEAAMMHHLDWSFQGSAVTLEQKKAIMDVVNSGGSFYDLTGKITKVVAKPYASSSDGNQIYYLTKHLIEIRAKDLMGGISATDLFPVGTGLNAAPAAEVTALAKATPQMGIGHVVDRIKLGDNFLQAIH